MPTTPAYITVFLIALGATFIATPLIRMLALRFGVLAMPSDRAVHAEPIPLLGGAAMLVGFLAAMGAAWGTGTFPAMFDSPSTIIGVVLGAIVLCAVGTLDDVRDVSAPAKTAGMVLAGSIMYLFGVSLLFFRFPFTDGLFILGPDLAPLITVLWVLGMANAVNLIDGLDGLAAGIVAIAAGSFFLYGHRLATSEVAVIGADNPLGVEGVRVKHTKTGEITEIPCKGVFIAIGHAPASELVKDQLETHNGGYVVVEPGSTRTAIPGVFAAGDLTDHIYRQAVTSAGMGCRAALGAEKCIAEME